MKKILLGLFTLIFVVSCQDASKESFATEAMDAEIMEAPMTEQSPNVAMTAIKIPDTRKIIWTGNLELQVKNVDTVTKKISKICDKYGAFVSDMSLTNTNYEISNNITVRVKSKDFTKLISDIKGSSIFIRRVEINSNDVTEEFIDIESRLKTKKEVRERYIDILKNKAGEIKDVIAAEEAIRTITEEIEAKEGRLRYLSNKVDLSTVNTLIFQKVDFKSEPNVYEKPYVTKMVEALKNGWAMVTEILLFVLNIWPFILGFVLIVWKRKWVGGIFRRKKSNKTN